MTDVIYDYPKSSCTCWECNKNTFVAPTGPPTNMSIRGNNFSDYYDCYQKYTFKEQIEPNSKSGDVILNPNVVSEDKFDKTFKAINVTNCPSGSCVGTTYSNSDPRLYSHAGISIQLDRPPFNPTTNLNTLTTDKSLNRYGQQYKSYADINAGQYLYYINRAREDSFFEPLFSNKAMSVGTMYQDPMGAMKPQHDLMPIKQCNPVLNNKGYRGETDEYSLSFIRDTQLHREDILARQMRKSNEQRYEPRWTNNNY